MSVAVTTPSGRRRQTEPCPRIQRRPHESDARQAAAAGSNVIAFDRAAGTVLPLAQVLGETTPERQRDISAHIVERRGR
jgi:hypothetical protein